MPIRLCAFINRITDFGKSANMTPERVAANLVMNQLITLFDAKRRMRTKRLKEKLDESAQERFWLSDTTRPDSGKWNDTTGLGYWINKDGCDVEHFCVLANEFTGEAAIRFGRSDQSPLVDNFNLFYIKPCLNFIWPHLSALKTVPRLVLEFPPVKDPIVPQTMIAEAKQWIESLGAEWVFLLEIFMRYRGIDRKVHGWNSHSIWDHREEELEFSVQKYGGPVLLTAKHRVGTIEALRIFLDEFADNLRPIYKDWGILFIAAKPVEIAALTVSFVTKDLEEPDIYVKL